MHCNYGQGICLGQRLEGFVSRITVILCSPFPTAIRQYWSMVQLQKSAGRRLGRVRGSSNETKVEMHIRQLTGASLLSLAVISLAGSTRRSNRTRGSGSSLFMFLILLLLTQSHSS